MLQLESWTYVRVSIGKIWRDTLIREIGGSFNAVRFSVFVFVGWFTNRSLHHLLFTSLFYLGTIWREQVVSQRLLLTWSASSLATRCIFISSSETLGDALPNTGVTRWPRHMLAAERRCDLKPSPELIMKAWVTSVPSAQIHVIAWLVLGTLVTFPLMPNMDEVNLCAVCRNCTLQPNQLFFFGGSANLDALSIQWQGKPEEKGSQSGGPAAETPVNLVIMIFN